MSSHLFRLTQALPWLPLSQPTIYSHVQRGQLQARKIPTQGRGYGPRRGFALPEDEIRRVLEAERAKLEARLRDHKERCAAFEKAVTAANGKSRA
jgi:hypothetical protein